MLIHKNSYLMATDKLMTKRRWYKGKAEQLCVKLPSQSVCTKASDTTQCVNSRWWTHTNKYSGEVLPFLIILYKNHIQTMWSSISNCYTSIQTIWFLFIPEYKMTFLYNVYIAFIKIPVDYATLLSIYRTFHLYIELGIFI